MKKTKILVPAVAVLALGMAASVTGTVAWFSQNTRVTADGMTLKAVTSKSLMISLTSSTGYANAVTMEQTTKTNVLPVSPVDKAADADPTASLANTKDDIVAETSENHIEHTVTNNVEFYRINISPTGNDVVNPGSHEAKHSIAEAITGVEGKTGFADSPAENVLFIKDNGANYAKDDIFLKYTDADAEVAPKSMVDMEITVGAAQELPLNAALHVGLLDVDAKKLYNYDVGGFAYTPQSKSYSLVVADFVQLTSKIEKQYTVFGWFEGEDSDCTTQNSVTVVGLNVTLAFALAD